MTTRQSLREEIEETRLAFHALLNSIPEEAYQQPSGNSAWTIAEVLYHMSLAPRLLPSDVKMIRSQSWVYKLISVLAPRRLFDWLNVRLTRIGGRRASRLSLARAYDQGHQSTLRALDSISEADLQKRAQYPDWDPMLSGEITLEDLFHYINHHFEAHKAQLTAALEPEQEEPG
jgi:uncharacterized damage-inducible protein DinB